MKALLLLPAPCLPLACRCTRSKPARPSVGSRAAGLLQGRRKATRSPPSIELDTCTRAFTEEALASRRSRGDATSTAASFCMICGRLHAGRRPDFDDGDGDGSEPVRSLDQHGLPPASQGKSAEAVPLFQRRSTLGTDTAGARLLRARRGARETSATVKAAYTGPQQARDMEPRLGCCRPRSGALPGAAARSTAPDLVRVGHRQQHRDRQQHVESARPSSPCAAAFAFAASSAGTRPSTFFWFGQMIDPDVERHDQRQPHADADQPRRRVCSVSASTSSP